MTNAALEHVNITVSDPEATAAWMGRVFGWNIRWQGAAMGNGHTIHVGSDAAYVALYNPGEALGTGQSSYGSKAGLNHLGVVVDDLDAVEEKVKAEGFTPNSHADYEPGRRFYFDDADGVEIEVVSYG